MPDTAVVQTQVHVKLGQSLGVAALGVVYGDIGTSPLYTVKQCFVECGRSPSGASSACCR